MTSDYCLARLHCSRHAPEKIKTRLNLVSGGLDEVRRHTADPTTILATKGDGLNWDAGARCLTAVHYWRDHLEQRHLLDPLQILKRMTDGSPPLRSQ